MQKNLSAVYSGEYIQWNTWLHSSQATLFMYKQTDARPGCKAGRWGRIVLLTRDGIFKNT